jgi:predicted HAD superfamily Cof-like phosphohydrolase
MHKPQSQVLEFHRKYEIKEQQHPHIPDRNTEFLRVRLIDEEINDELIPALQSGDLVQTADGLGDGLYVLYGTAISYGIDMEPIFDEIHRSNMTKDLIKKNGFGKVQKGEDFSPADIKSVLEKQLEGFGSI